MKQKTIITSKVEMLVVDLPDGATGIDVIKYWGVRNKICFRTPYVKGWERADNIDISDGNWQYTGKATELTEEDWMGIVEQKEKGYGVLVNKDYVKDRFTHSLFTATESGLSLLKANSVVLENENQDDWDELCMFGHGDFSKDGKTSMQLWKEAESKVWRNCHVFIKKD